MIAFVDPFNRGLSHVPVNVGIIETALLASHKEEMVITADSAHLDGLLDLLDPSLRNRIGSTVPLDLPEPGVRFVRRLRGDFANLAKVFGFSPGGADLIIADLAPATLHALRLNTLRHPGAFRRIAAVLHGNASEIAGWRARNPFVRITQLRSAMSLAPRQTRFVVLEASIQRALLAVAPEFQGRIVTVPHPLPLREGVRECTESTHDSESAGRPLKIGFLGAAQVKKGFGTFLSIARQLFRQWPGAVEFHAIGWLPPESENLDLACLARPPGREKISRSDFVAALTGVDYVCMPYDPDLYRYSASGTLIDAVACGKPVLAIRSPTLDDLQQDFGDIGELGDTAEDLSAHIDRLIRARDLNRYRAQVATLSRIAMARSPQQLIHEWQAVWADK